MIFEENLQNIQNVSAFHSKLQEWKALNNLDLTKRTISFTIEDSLSFLNYLQKNELELYPKYQEIILSELKEELSP